MVVLISNNVVQWLHFTTACCCYFMSITMQLKTEKRDSHQWLFNVYESVIFAGNEICATRWQCRCRVIGVHSNRTHAHTLAYTSADGMRQGVFSDRGCMAVYIYSVNFHKEHPCVSVFECVCICLEWIIYRSVLRDKSMTLSHKDQLASGSVRKR